jgi:hypothetical protein
MRYDRGTIDRALVLVAQGRSRKVAACATGMSISAVGYHAKEAGLVSARSEHGHRTAFKPGSRPFTPDEDATIESMRADRRGYAEIARTLGRAKSSIHSRIQTLDQIERRGGTSHA